MPSNWFSHLQAVGINPKRLEKLIYSGKLGDNAPMQETEYWDFVQGYLTELFDRA
jgi:hypothetical protein